MFLVFPSEETMAARIWSLINHKKRAPGMINAFNFLFLYILETNRRTKLKKIPSGWIGLRAGWGGCVCGGSLRISRMTRWVLFVVPSYEYKIFADVEWDVPRSSSAL